MKLFIAVVLLCCSFVDVDSKLLGCKVAAICEYSGGETKAEFRTLPTQREVNSWDSKPPTVSVGSGPGPGTRPGPTGKCGEPGWFTGKGGYQFKILGAQSDWETARDLCRVNGADLAYGGLSNNDNYQFITSFIKNYDMEGFWLGLTDMSREGDWKWIDGKGMTDPYWAPDQPDDNGGNQDCAYISRGRGYKLDDGDCYATFNILCERKI